MENKQPKMGQITAAMAIMCIAMLYVPIMDAIAKILATQHGISPTSIVWIRFAGQSLLLLLLIPPLLGIRKLKSEMTGINILRGLLIGLAVTCFFVALKYLPLADAIAIFFVEPLILMLLSAIFLNEKVGWRRIVAALFGFAGALLVIQPSFEEFGFVSLLPLGTATIFAVYLMLTRMFGTKDHPLTMQFWSGIGGMIMCSLILFLGEKAAEANFMVTLPETSFTIWMLFILVLIATSSHLLIVTAFTKAPASILAPFQYLEIIAMTLLGYFIFQEFPSLEKWIGILMIIASGIYVFYRERQIEQSVT